MIKTAESGISAKRQRMSRTRKIMLATGALILTIVVSGFVLWPGTPLDLGVGNQLQQAGFYRHWQNGEVIALVRHAERCDRSDNPCLGAADGITQAGSHVASNLGQAFHSLGMASADIISSPATRTRQTSEFMFKQAVQTQDWLSSCDEHFQDVIKAHKSARRNLVLITHSGCISKLESQLGFEHALASEYASSLFVTLNTDGHLQVLGIMNPQSWQQALERPLK